MNQMAYYNDLDFSNFYSRFHENDNVLVCRDNILYYNGETKIISGTYKVIHGECVNLGNFRVSNLDYQIWRLEPALLFFNIRESVLVKNITKESLYQFLTQIINLCSKNILTASEEASVISFADYYSSLKTIEPYLRNELLDVYNDITKYIINAAKEMDSYNITPGFKIIYEKMFGELKNTENDSSSNETSKQRVKSSSNKPKIVPIPIPIQDIKDKELNNSAFINIVILSILLIGTVVLSTILFLS